METLSATWEGLVEFFRCPDWFRDAKFGVWSHWGPQSVPGCGDWYARNLYVEGTRAYRHHRRVYGHPSRFGYKDVVRLWTAERFDARELAELYRENGARYLVGQASHCDNFDLFDSSHHRWNAVRVGPCQDILGAWRDAAREQGLPFGFSEHLAWSYSWFGANKGADRDGPYAGVPYDGNDPAFADLYWEPHDDREASYPIHPSPAFVESWRRRLTEAIDRYEPDLMYTDGGIPFGRVGLEVMAHFYRRNLERNGGVNRGVYTYKNVPGRRAGPVPRCLGEFRPGAGVEDLERGVLGGIEAEPWQTDTDSGGWFYDTDQAYKTPGEIIHLLIDVVSKNGNLLLNYTQRPDGSLDEETRWTVEEVGGWLRTNGEAIYGTRPWRIFGEGPTQFAEGECNESSGAAFGPDDFRFTTRGDVLYAIGLGRPAREWTLRALAGEPVRRVSLLGYDAPLTWQAAPDALRVAAPADLPGGHAWGLRIEQGG